MARSHYLNQWQFIASWTNIASTNDEILSLGNTLKYYLTQIHAFVANILSKNHTHLKTDESLLWTSRHTTSGNSWYLVVRMIRWLYSSIKKLNVGQIIYNIWLIFNIKFIAFSIGSV